MPSPASQPAPMSRAAAERPVLGVVLALVAVALWGSTAVIARHLALEGVSMTVVAFLRVAIGGTVLGCWLAATAATPVRGALVPWHDRWVWMALLCYGGNMLTYHWALARTSASVVMVLENTAPVVALLGGAWLFRERVTWRALVALGLAFGGAVLVCSADPGIGAAARADAAVGNALALLSGLTWGGYTLACRGQGSRTGGRRDGLSSMVTMLLGSALLQSPTLWGSTNWPSTPAAWGWVLVLSVFHTALATVCWRLALNHIAAYTASLLFLLTILLTMVNAAVFLGERVSPRMLLGAGAIIAALLALFRPTGRPNRKPATPPAVRRDP